MAIHEYMLSHKDVVKAIIIHRNIHEGFWCLNINFNIAATHGAESPNPCVALSIMSIGITQSPEANDLTVDAAVVNPWRAAPVAATAEAPPPPAPPKPIVSNTIDVLANLPARFSRNVYGNVAFHFPNGQQQNVTASNGVAPSNGHAANGTNGANGVHPPPAASIELPPDDVNDAH